MCDVIIRAERLGKSYRLGQATVSERYAVLRESVSACARRAWRAARSALDRQRPSTALSSEEFWALRNVSFDVRRGETLGIIGRNGAGKSTLLKILSRITEPAEGRVTLRGRVASLLEVGTGFHPELTGRENIYLNGAILGMTRSEIARKFDDIVAFAEVQRFLDTPVKRYSSGMYVRLAFSVAAHLEPDILIVDEVLAVGDIQFQQKCLGKMEQVSAAGRTVLFVSHNLAAVKRLCTRALLLAAGTVTHAGTAEAVIAHYIKARDSGAPSRMLDVCSREVDCSVRETSVQSAGDDIVVRLRVTGSHALPALGIGLTVRSEEGETVLIVRPAKTGFGLRASDLPCDVVISLTDLARVLSGGRYWIDVWVNDPGVQYLGQLDDACSFEVPERDLYGTGRCSNARDDGLVSIKSRFTVTRCDGS
jgi:lipopolysaccharide transport system ATP-binding protein